MFLGSHLRVQAVGQQHVARFQPVPGGGRDAVVGAVRERASGELVDCAPDGGVWRRPDHRFFAEAVSQHHGERVAEGHVLTGEPEVSGQSRR